ncbi:MAG: flavin reductase family protein [Alphaproteobacteria bacterium]|nr:flavin reductase family protein [Alphaproteobacteria bacterium]
MNPISRAFRDALGHFATGVAVVTARNPDGEALGLTINSFASVSLDPPLVLWSLDKASDRFQAFMKVKHYAVNILSGEARALSQRLSRKGESALKGEALREGVHGAPILESAIAHFECQIEARHDGGDHIIFVGRVLDFGHAGHGHPLVYFRGRYRELTELEG